MTDPRPSADGAGDHRRFPVDLLRDFIVRALVKKSVFQYDAQTVADRLLEADLRGIPAHGVHTLPALLAAINQGDVDPRGRVLVERETAAIAVLDGSRALGQVAATKGMQIALAKAREVGTGTVSIHHSQHLGAASVYALLAAQEGLIGFCTSASGGAVVTAPNSSQAAVPNAPFAWAVPSAEGPPIVVDFACGAISSGQIEVLSALGLPIPDGVALDADGQPTTEPAAARRILPAGGTRGFGLGLVATLLSSGLAGGKIAHQKTRSPASDCAEHLLMAIDVAQFTDPVRFGEKAADARRYLQSLAASDPHLAVRSPGDRGWREAEVRRQHGIPIPPADLDRLAQLATRLKLDISWAAAS